MAARIKAHDARRSRIKALRQRLGDTKVDALLVSNAVDIRYLTGFIGDDSWALIPARGSAVLILSDNRFQEQIKREAPGVKARMRKKGLAEELAKVCAQRGYKAVGVQPDHMTLGVRKALVKQLNASAVKPIDDGLITQRSVKARAEVASIRKALSCQQEAFRKLRRFIKPGMTEVEVCAKLEYEMRRLGADGPSFPTIVAADANAALPHAIPGPRKLKRGGVVLIDWGAKADGYCSDLTRVLALGSMSRKMREVYQIVLDAQLAGIDAIRPGVALKDVDAAARKVIKRAGYAKEFGHSLGHGIGLDIHEQPVLSARAEGVLEPGHVVTVEPGIYLPGVGGVRIEDDVLVTARGHRVLSDLPKSLESAII